MIDQRDKARGALVGLAVGDALGAPYEFKRRDTFKCTGMVDGGTFDLKAGQWTDDTSMALCLAESLLEHPEFDAADCMDRFARWCDEGHNSSTGQCFDVGANTSRAIDNYLAAKREGRIAPPFEWGEPGSAGNGCIMRIAPVPIMWFRNKDVCNRIALQQCRLTHDAPECEIVCTDVATLVACEILGVCNTPDWSDIPRERVNSSGYVAHTMSASLWSLATTKSFEDALLAAVNLGDDSDTVGAVTGQIAGALYGMSAIPREWLDVLHERDRIIEIADRLFNRMLS